MKIRIAIMAIVGSMVALVFGGTAWADVFTPAISEGGASLANCRFLNTGTTTVKGVVIDIRSSTNVSLSNDTFDIEAGTTQSVNHPANDSIVYCRVSGISKGRARVSLCIIDVGATAFDCVTSP